MDHHGNIARRDREGGRAPRRLIGLERHYRCGACGHEQRSWSRVRSCPACGEPLSVAVIRRAALI